MTPARLSAALAALLIVLALFPSRGAAGEVYLWRDADLTHLLTPSEAARLPMGLTPQFEIADDRSVILLTRDGGLFDLRKRVPLPSQAPLRIDAFTISAGLIVAVRGDVLGWYESGKVQDRLRLPGKGLRVASGPGQRLYLWGPRPSGGSTVRLLESGRASTLIEVPKGRISALTAIGERLFYAVDSAIYTVAKGERAGLLFVASGEGTIRSLAADPYAGMLYFSSGREVYAMRAGTAVSILRGVEGYLRCSGKALYALDPKAGRMIRVTGLERLTGGGAAEMRDASGGFKE
jgi:hypothetical protein